MQYQPCYFYVEHTQEQPGGIVWPLCEECGKKWPNAMFWNGPYGPWEVRCHNPACSTKDGLLIWDGVTPSDMP